MRLSLPRMGLGLAPTSTIGTRKLLQLGPVALAAKLGAALTQWVYIYVVMGPAELNKPGWELMAAVIALCWGRMSGEFYGSKSSKLAL